MEQTFDEYIVAERKAFVMLINAQKWDNTLRKGAEDLLIAYDQMREKLKADNWISCKDRLPTNREYQWVSDGVRCEAYQAYYMDDYYSSSNGAWLDRFGNIKHFIEFWQPVPQPIKPEPPYKTIKK